MDIFVGGLPATMRQRELMEIFGKYGEVTSVNLIMDHVTRLNKGFGFVKMPDRNQALSAIGALNGVELEGRKLIVNESKFKKGEGRTGESPRRPGPETERYKTGEGTRNHYKGKGGTANRDKGKPRKW